MRFSTRPLVMDLSRESRLLGLPLGGLIGMDFFAGRSVQIDFKASCLRVSPDQNEFLRMIGERPLEEQEIGNAPSGKHASAGGRR